MSKVESIDLKNYKKIKKIGAGSFGEVFMIEEKKTGKQFAAKISSKYFFDKNVEEIKNLTREIEIISKISHPSVIQFIGFSKTDFEEEDKPVIVTDYAPNGSLNDMIQLERSSEPKPEWTETRKLINIYGIAAAMDYLHFNNIIHRDLKPENILLDRYLHPKIADFGLSKDESVITSTNGIKGTPYYIAPEIFEENNYSQKSDVYAFGILVYEIITGERPFNKKYNQYQVQNRVCKGERPDIKKVHSEAFRELIKACWDKAPESRPTFVDIRKKLKKNKDFITEEIDENAYRKYVEKIDRSSKHFDKQKSFSFDEEADTFDLVRLDKKRILSNDKFVKLSKQCQNLVNEATCDPDAQFKVGKYLIEASNGFPKDIDTGIKYLKASIKELNIDSAIYYNRMLISGKLIKQNLKKAKSNLKHYSVQNNPEINVLIGIIERKDKNYAEAIDYFYDKCQKNAEACYQLGKMLYRGEGTELNKEEAHAYFKLAKKKGCKKVDNFILKEDKKKKKTHEDRKRIDIVFLVDGHSSMLSIHHAFRNQLSDISEIIQEKYPKIIFRYASVIYNSKPIADLMPKAKSPKSDKVNYIKFTDDLDEIEAFITKNKTRSLYRPSDWASGYECLINDIKWNKDADKIVIHISNTPGLGKSFTMDPFQAKKLIKIPDFGKKNPEKNASIFETIQIEEDDRFKKMIKKVAKKGIKFYCQNYSKFALQCFKRVGDFYKKNGGQKFIVEDQLEVFQQDTKFVDDNKIKTKIKKFILELIKTCAEADADDDEDNLFETQCNNQFEEDLEDFTNHRKQSKKKPEPIDSSSDDDDDDDEDSSKNKKKTKKDSKKKKPAPIDSSSDDDEDSSKNKKKTKKDSKKKKPTPIDSSSDDDDEDSSKNKKKTKDSVKAPIGKEIKKDSKKKKAAPTDSSSEEEDSSKKKKKTKEEVKPSIDKETKKSSKKKKTAPTDSSSEEEEDSSKKKKKTKEEVKPSIDKEARKSVKRKTSHFKPVIIKKIDDDDDSHKKETKTSTDEKKKSIESNKKEKKSSSSKPIEYNSEYSSDDVKDKKKTKDEKKKPIESSKKKKISSTPKTSSPKSTEYSSEDDDDDSKEKVSPKKKTALKEKRSITKSSDESDDDDDSDDAVDFNKTSKHHVVKKKDTSEKKKTEKNPFDFYD